MTTSYSPARSPASSRIQFGVGSSSRLRSSSLKKPPEPLRRAVADCLSSAAPSHLEASRTLRDYLSNFATIDLAYGVILEHTLAERERSPAVVARCVTLLKRYLLRYKPTEETLLQIDRFCTSVIAECDVSPNRKLATWSRSLSQQNVVSAPSTNVTPLPVSSFASGALVKSLNYVRSLVAQYIPKRSFQPAAFAGAPSAARQSLPTLSSLLRKSFNTQLTPANGKEPSDSKVASLPSVTDSPVAEEVDEIKDLDFIASDFFQWRWCGDQHSSPLLPKSDHILDTEDVRSHNFLEVGAAALLVGDVDAKMSESMPYLDQVLQPSLLTTVTNSTSAFSHLRAITALRRSRPGTTEIWEESNMSTFRPRVRPLFQYRHYSEQQPLRLNPVEVCEVIAAVCSETPSASSNQLTISSKLRHTGKPSMDVAVSVLVKLVIDMYVLDSKSAATLTLSMLEDMLNYPRVMSKTRAFDLILNLGVHAHLLEPPAPDESTTTDEEYSQDVYADNGTPVSSDGKRKFNVFQKTGNYLAIDKFEGWILCILYEILLHLVQVEEREEAVWASSLSCLLYFVCDKGNIRQSKLKGLDIRVVQVLIQISRKNSWAEIVHCKLISMMTNMFYQVSEGPNKVITATPLFMVNQVDLIGGIEFIFVELVLCNSTEERRNLYLVLFDYVLHKINETCTASGVTEYSDDEIRPIATLLVRADAPEALHISVKLGLEGIVELLRVSISRTLSTYPNNERLVMLLELIVEKFDVLVGSFIHLDKEFVQMIQTMKSFKSVESIDSVQGNTDAINVTLAWTTLHSLLHSERSAYHINGHLWLGDLLIAEISEEGNPSLWSSIKNLEKKISLAGVGDYSASLDIPLPIWLMCGLLKSKNNIIRWGFLFVLERLLMRCKFLLDESEVQHSLKGESAGRINETSRLEKANVLIDIMSCALSLVAQINETDRMIILKMCDILLSQLCLKVTNMGTMPFGDMIHVKDFSSSWRNKEDGAEHISLIANLTGGDFRRDVNKKLGENVYLPVCETASMAALLLHGQAIVPMQLVSRVPAALFYWPLIQLASAATDDIALGVSVGSKGRGNLPGGTSDIRATLLLLLIGKCTADPDAFTEVGGKEFFRELLDDTDARVAYYSSTFLLKRMMTEQPERYQRMLHSLVSRAQQSNNEKLLENPYLQMRGFLQLSTE